MKSKNEELKHDSNTFERVTKINIENICKEKDNLILEKQSLTENLNELQAQ